MALPPGYLALLESARARGLTEETFTRDDAIFIEQHMLARGWAISADWQNGSSRTDSLLIDRPEEMRTVIVFTHPSDEEQVEDVLENIFTVSQNTVCHRVSVVRVSLGKYVVQSCDFVLSEVVRRVRAITGVRVQR